MFVRQGRVCSWSYNSRIRNATLLFAVVEALESRSGPMRDVIRKHFRLMKVGFGASKRTRRVGSVRFGSVWFGPVDPVRPGSVGLGSARFDWVRGSGPVRSGPVRFGSVRFESARFPKDAYNTMYRASRRVGGKYIISAADRRRLDGWQEGKITYQQVFLLSF